MIVTNPLDQSTKVNKVIKDCSFGFGGYVFLTNLMLLSFHDFDAILGLDWLTRHKAPVECKSRGVWLIFADSNKVFISGMKRDIKSNTI